MIIYEPKSRLARRVASGAEYPGANDSTVKEVDALVEQLESTILVALDCEQRWSRGHAERIAKARELLSKAKG